MHLEDRVDLSGSLATFPEQGLLGPDGVLYRRRSTRLKRRRAEEMVLAGVPVVMHRWSEGQLEWFSGELAGVEWAAVKPLIKDQPGTGPGFTAGVWEGPDGQQLLVVIGEC